MGLRCIFKKYVWNRDRDQDSKEAPPPPYDDQDPSPAQDLSPSDWETAADATGGPCSLHGLTCKPDMFVQCCAGTTSEPEWMAHFQIYADIPRLMKEGFYWSEDNARRQCSRFSGGKYSAPEHKRVWPHVRVYHLMDTSWKGIIVVYADELSVLSKFRLNQITMDKICLMRAAHKNHCIYQYKKLHPEDSFNALYDDKPLDGWWPWPDKE
ncbi:hypothetical protein G6O67_007522 [Ophiocordyceps sinensis]|uniref:Uncharacterized protein n=2 Tax=Ophiocordyceps sinensis TaxID=72228 RepID=A0A8H4LU36_9HYPO|nr:hypothetical protein OCS_00772 [Ophiocordyceps sinensis CO18]KAF4505590.1 hypothetical protein G6O67_007522 [Ophiocordyceps sinensis]